MKFRHEWAIPDVHGEDQKLEALLKHMQAHGWLPEEDLLVFLGDMVDRGPYSRQVINRIKELCEKYPENIKALFGNHDRFFADGMIPKRSMNDWKQLHLWLHYNGGDDTKVSYIGHQEVVAEHVAWVENLPLSFETEKHFYSHAPVPSYFSHYELVRTDEQTLTWAYNGDIPEDQFAYNFKKHGKVGICGHIHALRQGIWEPRVFPHYVYLDAGCGCHPFARLFAANLTTRTFYTSSDEVISMDM